MLLADYNDVLNGSTHFPVIYGLGKKLNFYMLCIRTA